MQVKKGELNFYVEFLSEMKLPNKASLGRTKLKQGFTEKLTEFGKDQIEIIDEYDAWKDKEKGIYDNTNIELTKSMNVLALDDVQIDFKSPFKKNLVEALENYDVELSGQNAEIYAKLYKNLIKEND
jgi:hypothetical protein